MKFAAALVLVGLCVAGPLVYSWLAERRCPVCAREFGDMDAMHRHLDRAHLTN